MTDLNTPGAQQAIHHPRWYRVGRALDKFLNALILNGSDNETISHNAARRRAEGASWAKILCAVLSVIVERDHCSRSLDPTEIAMPAALRAGFWLLVLLGLIVWGAHVAWRWLF